ncbi:hypothetical protein [Cesiribacter andamanensis]|uniref:Uncharacterized protein n=1 Tax=Cesiribacter andamanensis AMV16 TaxID=1279009 RepID=M7N1C8_9BACT|nr:hypothetical protein [Cesiribacter andamanensis]EMR01021.1 hypothetical protein ADICEAN_03853 [Cesiribacter andamanensis AMV16]
MLKQLLSCSVLVLFLAGCAQHREADLSEKRQQANGGLFFLSDSIQGHRVKEDLRFNKKGYAFVQEEPILSLSDAELGFFYDSVIASDTFALLTFDLSDSALQQWQAKTAGASRKRVGLVVDEELIRWFPLSNSPYPALQLCYCEYSRNEIQALEQRLKGLPH